MNCGPASISPKNEINCILKAAKKGRYGKREHTMVLVGFRLGLRVSELCDLKWSDVDFKQGTIHIRRLKGPTDSTHYIEGHELRALRVLKREAETPLIFESERGGPISAAGFRKQFARCGRAAKLDFPVNPYMLRHA